MSVTEGLEAARLRSAEVYPASGRYRGVYVKGALAALLGHNRSTCPYRRSASTSWVNTWRSAWLRGFDSIAVDDLPMRE